FVSDVLQGRGFKLCFVNPNYAGRTILGEKVYASIRDIPDEIDIVDVFRRPSAVPALAEEAKKKGFKVFWMQPGAESPEAIKQLDKEGYGVVAGRCAKIESSRLL
ncbi:MAG: CoA-binding protein, partial [Methanothrix sp.]|nr:CoA-binding protein [Methanothrix sp.]